MPIEAPPPAPLRRRVDGWTPCRQREFLAVLAQTRSITRAARAVGLSRTAAYRLRSHPAARDFAAAWDGALAFRPS
ncbi:MAG TPA: LysR family transcriptional regulator [Sphingobium sp.]